MNKGDLISAIAKEARITKTSAEKAINCVTQSISKALKKNDRVSLVGFGSFYVARRKKRMTKVQARRTALRI